MAVDVSPVQLGAVYFEDGSGEDQAGDTIELTFSGGAPGTQLSQVVIDTDKLGDGLTIGDVFFDTASGGLGAFANYGFQLVSKSGIDTLNATVTDGGTRLTLDFTGFEAGDRLVFQIDVDEQGFLSPNAVAEGNEFEGSKLTGLFAAPHFQDGQVNDVFLDAYNGKLQTSGLTLPPDDYVPPGQTPHPVYTAGAMGPLVQIPLPITISGNVYEDKQVDGERQPGDPGIAGVTLKLMQFDGNDYVATNQTAVTDADGHYTFTGILPGKYCVMEAQPDGYLSVASNPGSVDGSTRGVSEGVDMICEIELAGGEDSVNNDFGETLPASLSGHVYHDRNDNGIRETGEEPIEGVLVEVSRVSVGGPPAAPITVLTDSSGYWIADNLMPGSYVVTEVHPSGWIDGKDAAGSAGGAAVNPGDQISGATLVSGTAGVNYDFGELKPVGISGQVFADLDEDCVRDEGEAPIAGVKVYLLNGAGQRIDETTTDADGQYSFTNLEPGTYGVEEVQPSDFLHGGQMVGTAGGNAATDKITSVVLASGALGTGYDFCEVPPAKLSGFVYVHANNNGVMDSGEQGIAGATVELLDGNGQSTGQTITTDASGMYMFGGLRPGKYGVRETQPSPYLDGLDSAGTHGGAAQNPGDLITGAMLMAGQVAQNYNFGELVAAELRGRVFADSNNDCVQDEGESGIQGVEVLLYDAANNLVATTTTDASGQYDFTGLRPGTYRVVESHPGGYLQGGQVVGDAGGAIGGTDVLTGITLASGQIGSEYNFCEIIPAAIEGYVFQDGPTIVYKNESDIPKADFDLTGLRDGQRDSSDTPLAGVRLVLGGVNGEVLLRDDGTPIETFTDANGHYRFDNLLPGTYSVLQDSPDGYFKGIDTAGTAGGVVFNFVDGVFPDRASVLAAIPTGFDAIGRVTVFAGETSFENNFSEVRVAAQPVPPRIPTPDPTPPLTPFIPQVPFFGNGPTAAPIPPGRPPEPPLLFGSGGELGYTWHLSVINGGQPRAIRPGGNHLVKSRVARGAGWNGAAWNGAPMDHGLWLIDRDGDGKPEQVAFGAPGAIPLAGDFNGDGQDELALFLHGQWYVDLNGDGTWDSEDLWAQLGGRDDLPVVGDWDGDGKADIGVFGPEWAGDARAVFAEPGLPEANNDISGVAKNLPPEPGQATTGSRVLQRTASGAPRSDVIDHVFLYGSEGDWPLVGDFNGDGVSTIGVFRKGQFVLDTNGNGRLDPRDQTIAFGQPGRPVVGDFDADGRDELGLFRGGTWRVDTDHNNRLDAHDRVFQMGQGGDIPVAGDWNGDGQDEPGVYRGNTFIRE